MRREDPGGAHPRACGENRSYMELLPWKTGSSPRVRGKHGDRALPGEVHGLIPARAGKTRMAPDSGPEGAAHPRACGENVWTAVQTPIAAGSSPRVRGKPGRVLVSRGRRGLIPARAGKTASWASTRPAAWAHPRACGENLHTEGTNHDDSGSSPRVRGKRSATHTMRPISGLIPARAGKTARAAYGTPTSRAHPRACGENALRMPRKRAKGGSSPRVRGKPWIQISPSLKGRLIPARAGKTSLL